jgi:hypothetical protein
MNTHTAKQPTFVGRPVNRDPSHPKHVRQAGNLEKHTCDCIKEVAHAWQTD